MTHLLALVAFQGEPRLDSRLMARSLDIEHKAFLETLRKYEPELQTLGQLPFQTEVGTRKQGGGNPAKYALLNEDQAIFAVTLSRNTRQVVAFKLHVTHAFAQARQQAQAQAMTVAGPVHHFTDVFRTRALANINRVPQGYFSVMGELFKHLYNLESVLRQALDTDAMLEISVGQQWACYTREVLHLPEQQRRKYAHLCQDGRTVQAWAYPLHYVNTFGSWLWEDYFPRQFPAYQAYRAARLPTPATPLLPQPNNQHSPLLSIPQRTQEKP